MKKQKSLQSFLYDSAAVLAAICMLAALGSLSFFSAAVFGSLSASSFLYNSSLQKKAERKARALRRQHNHVVRRQSERRSPVLQVAQGGVHAA